MVTHSTKIEFSIVLNFHLRHHLNIQLWKVQLDLKFITRHKKIQKHQIHLKREKKELLKCFPLLLLIVLFRYVSDIAVYMSRISF